MTISVPSYLGRSARIVFLALLFGFRLLFRRASGPQLLRMYLEQSGAAFVKLGQILAMRYDLMPIEYCRELGDLLDKLPADPSEGIAQLMEKELGRPLEDIFLDFDRHATHAASVAQVHEATLLDGTRVIVKVKRPGIDLRYRIDLLNLRLLAGFIEWCGFFPLLDIRGVTKEIVQLAEEELDFRQEARNIHVLHELMLRDDIDHYSPKVYLSLCNRSFLVMEKLSGVWMRELMAAIEGGDQEKLSYWKTKGITPERSARLLLRSVLQQCFSHRIFHADPHAGNLLLMDGGTLAFVDFGMIGWIDEDASRKHLRMNRCIAKERVHGAYLAFLDIIEPLPRCDLSRFESEFKGLLQNWILFAKTPCSSLPERTSGFFLLRLFDLLRRERLNMPFSDMRLNRTLIISDVIVLKLDPALDRLPELNAYFHDEGPRLAREISNEHSVFDLENMAMCWADVVDALSDAMVWWRDGTRALNGRCNEQVTLAGQGAAISARYFRRIALAALTLLLIARVGRGWFAGNSFMERLAYATGWWWFGVGGSLFLILWMNSYIRQAKR